MLGGHEGDRGRPWIRAACPGLPACVAARSSTSFRTMVAVRLSQQEQQPHHCYGTGEIDDGRHICGLLARAWYRGHCQNAAENVITQRRPAATGAVRNLYRTCGFCLPRDAASGQPAPDGRRTCLLWLIEAHAHASKAGRMRIGPGHAECPDLDGSPRSGIQTRYRTYRRECALRSGRGPITPSADQPDLRDGERSRRGSACATRADVQHGRRGSWTSSLDRVRRVSDALWCREHPGGPVPAVRCRDAR